MRGRKSSTGRDSCGWRRRWDGTADGDRPPMTPWQVVGIAFGLVAYAVAGIWGGRPERFGAGLLIIYCMLSAMAYGWEVNGFFPGSMALDFLRVPVFVWLCLRSDRWWPFVIAAALGLMVLTNAVR